MEHDRFHPPKLKAGRRGELIKSVASEWGYGGLLYHVHRAVQTIPTSADRADPALLCSFAVNSRRRRSRAVLEWCTSMCY
jgi:hypothetical protein